jgi:hypothetical protein
MGIFRAWLMTQRPNRHDDAAGKDIRLAQFFFSIMMNDHDPFDRYHEKY